jgi:uncharacterized protein YbbK (DUF523 family)
MAELHGNLAHANPRERVLVRNPVWSGRHFVRSAVRTPRAPFRSTERETGDVLSGSLGVRHPRETPDIDGGNGFDVLDGRARVLSDSGEDWTEGMVRAAEAMLDVARINSVHLAVLTDISAACGSQVIYLGPRTLGLHQAGQGVCTAMLIRHGFKVVSQRDYRTLGRVIQHLDPSFVVDQKARDHHESDWYVEQFGI